MTYTFTFTYQLTNTENLIFVGNVSEFEIFSKPEGGNQERIARFNGGKWKFDNIQQRQLFLVLFNNNRMSFYRGIKSFRHKIKEYPKFYEFTCIRRKFKIQVSKIKNNFWNSLYSTFYSK